MSMRDRTQRSGHESWDRESDAYGDRAPQDTRLTADPSPSPEELERLVAMLGRRETGPDDRLSRALEGLARWSEAARAPEPVRQQAPAQAPRPAEPRSRPAAPASGVPDELQSRLSDYADQLGGGRAQARAPETPPIASLRAALAEIAARQKTLDDEDARFSAAAQPEPRPAAPRSREPEQRVEPRRQEEPVAPAHRSAPREEPYRPRSFTPAPAPRVEPEPVRAAPPRPAREQAAPPAPRDTENLKALAELRAELNRIGGAVSSLPTRDEIDSITREMTTIAAKIGQDRPARLDRDSLSAIDALVAEVDRMRSDAASPRVITELSEEVHAITARLEVLGPRSASAIEALTRRVDDLRGELDRFPRGQALDTVAGEIQSVIERLDAQERLAKPTREAVVGLSSHVLALDDKISAIADAATRRDDAFHRINEEIRAELDSLPRAEAVTGLGRQIDVLTEGLKSRSAIGPALKAVEGLSDKVEALDDRISDLLTRQHEQAGWVADSVRDGLAASSKPDLFDGLGRKIDALTSSIAAQRNAPMALPALDSLVDRVDGLGERVESMASATRSRGASFDRIEESVRTIAEQLAANRSGSDTSSRAIEQEVVRVVEKLELQEERIEDLHAAFAGVATRIERSCADLGAHAAETAISAARDALALAAPAASSEPADRLEDGIARALDNLRASTVQSERRSAETLEAVRDALDRLLERMPDRASLSLPIQPPVVAPVQTRAEADRPRDEEFAFREAVREIARPAPEREERAQTRMPRADAHAAFAQAQAEIGPDFPLEPGARPVPNQQSQSAASFIAQARRATAQSIAEEAVADAVGENAAEPSRFAGALAALKTKRRPLLLGLAAALVVLAALYVASGMTSHSEEPVADPAPMSRAAPIDEPKFVLDTSGRTPVTTPSGHRANEVLAPDLPTDVAAPAPSRAELDPAPAGGGAPTNIEPAGRADQRQNTSSNGAVTGFQATQTATAAARGAEWRVGEPATTGSIARASTALPEKIGGPTLRVRATAGDAGAQLEVADRLLEGRNVEPDAESAALWLEKAAAQGLAPAQQRLGSLYEKGRGVSKDINAARRLYEQAAASGNVRAMHNLGVIHAEGGLGKADYAAASIWFRMAAERGLVDSQYNLAVLEARGLMGKRDLKDAYKWFALAADQGDEDAGRKRDDVAKALGAQASAAKAEALAFRAKAVDQEANEAPSPPGGWDRSTDKRAAQTR